MNYIYFFALLIALAIIDFNIIRYLWIRWQEFTVNVERFFFRLRLEKDIFLIRYSRWKYLKMAKEILKDLENKDEQVQP